MRDAPGTSTWKVRKEAGITLSVLRLKEIGEKNVLRSERQTTPMRAMRPSGAVHCPLRNDCAR